MLYFPFRIIMGLLVMKVAPGVPVFSTIWRAIGLDCCDMGWESPFEPEQDNACVGSVHFYFPFFPGHTQPSTLWKSRDQIFLYVWSAPTGYSCFLPRRLHGNVHDFLNQFAYWHFSKKKKRYSSWHACNLVVCDQWSQTSVRPLYLAKQSHVLYNLLLYSSCYPTTSFYTISILFNLLSTMFWLFLLEL